MKRMYLQFYIVPEEDKSSLGYSVPGVGDLVVVVAVYAVSGRCRSYGFENGRIGGMVL